MHRSLLAQDETLLSTTGAGAMEQRGSGGAAALRRTTSAIAGRDFGYELLHCGDAYARSNRPDIYPDSTARSVYDDQDITTGRRRRARGLRSYENTVDETDG
jgi:hypothetical protein